MNKFDKLASEIISSYNNLTEEQKFIVDTSDELTEEERDSFGSRDFSNFLHSLPTVYIRAYSAHYIRNPKDLKVIILFGNFRYDYFKSQMSSFKWCFKGLYDLKITKTFKEALMFELRERGKNEEIKLVEKYTDSEIENMAISALKTKDYFRSVEEFIKNEVK